MTQYMAVPALTNFKVDKGNVSAAFQEYSNMLNQYAQQGWVYHSMETLTVTEAAGCPIFSSPTTSSFYVMIFFRNV